MKKNFTLFFIAISTIGSVYALAHNIKMDGFSFAWALNFLLMFFVTIFTGVLKSQFSSSYFNEKEWEQQGEIYAYFGINFFRKLLVWIGWEKIIRKDNPVARHTKALMHLYYQTKKSELDHVIIFIIVLGFNVFVAFKFGVIKSVWLLTLNLILNLYPIFLQRYNRPRIASALNLSKRKQ